MKKIVNYALTIITVIVCVCMIAYRPVAAATEAGGLTTVDLVIFAGQSNMSGAGGNAAAAPAVPHDCGYEFRCGQDPMGMYEVAEPFGVRENGYLSDPQGLRLGTLVSAFMNKYYNITGVPVLGVSMSRGGTDMVSYWSSAPVQAEMMTKYNNALAWCDANHVKVRKQYVVWLQGESDAINGVDASTYQTLLNQLYAPLLAKGVQQVFVITPGNFGGIPGAYETIINAQKGLCAKNPNFTLGSEALHNLPNTYLVDGVHYNQSALNMVGEEAAAVAAAYSRLH